MVVKATLKKEVQCIARREVSDLILALIILALLSLLVAAMLTAVTVEVWIGDNFARETQLVYLAEAGIEEGREQLQTIRWFARPSHSSRMRRCSTPRGREAGRYSVTLLRSDPLTLRSAGVDRDRAQDDRGAAEEVRFSLRFPMPSH